MTGIAAILSSDPVRPEQLARMTKALALRRHDDLETVVNGVLGLSACLWHTTEESLDAGQPLASSDRDLAIVMDGFLVNWQELRSDLQSRGVRLRNRSDAELVLRAYEIWGDDCASRLDGEFAFAIADWRRRRLYCARDHLGLKPLFVAQAQNRILIASDIAAIIAGLDEQPEPDWEFLACLAAGQVFSGDRTAWKGVRSLPHAHWMACEDAVVVSRRYYALPDADPIRYRTDEEYAEHHRSELFEAVRKTSRSQAPLAFEVSGGLDSSALFAVADRLHREDRLFAPEIRGYTLAGEPGTPAYELPFARAVAEYVGRSIAEVPMFRPERDWYSAQALIDQNVPPPTNEAMSINLERCAASDGSRVLVNGLGGDEWLGGSQIYYRQFAQDRDLAGFVTALRGDMATSEGGRVLRNAFRMGLSGILPDRLRDIIRGLRRDEPFGGMSDPQWLRPEWRNCVAHQRAEYIASLPRDFNALARHRRFASPWALYSRSTMQRQPAANGLEMRFPLLSRRFVEFSSAVPEYLRRRAGVNKFTHRNALRGLLPHSVVNRTTKAAFPTPEANLDFLRFCEGAGYHALGTLVAPEQIASLFSQWQTNDVDGGMTWEIYGLHAVACFPGRAISEISRASDKP